VQELSRVTCLIGDSKDFAYSTVLRGSRKGDSGDVVMLGLLSYVRE